MIELTDDQRQELKGERRACPRSRPGYKNGIRLGVRLTSSLAFNGFWNRPRMTLSKKRGPTPWMKPVPRWSTNDPAPLTSPPGR